MALPPVAETARARILSARGTFIFSFCARVGVVEAGADGIDGEVPAILNVDDAVAAIVYLHVNPAREGDCVDDVHV